MWSSWMRAPTDAPHGVTLHDVAERIRGRLLSLDPGSSGILETRLSAAGYRVEDDYSIHRWLEGATHIYLVAGNFPRITSGERRSGVSNVRYSISLADCEPFATSVSALNEALAGR